MSDEAPETVGKAFRNYFGALGFIVTLIGAEMMKEGQYLLGVVLALAGLPIFLSAVFFKWVTSHLSRRLVISLNDVATSIHWWVALFLFAVLAAAATIVQSYVWILVGLSSAAILLALLFETRRNPSPRVPRIPLGVPEERQPYVANITFSLGKLQNDRAIEIEVQIFNPTGSTILAVGCDGLIGLKQKNARRGILPLHGHKHVDNGSNAASRPIAAIRSITRFIRRAIGPGRKTRAGVLSFLARRR